MTARKAQSSFEFVLLVGAAFAAAIIFLFASADDMKDLIYKREHLFLKEQGDRIAQEISLAVQVEDGYRRSFLVPEKIDNKEYGIVMSNRTLTLTSDHTTYILRVPRIEGSVAKGWNNITREDGIVRLNNG